MSQPGTRTGALAALLFALALGIYWLSAVALERTASPDAAYFNLLADALLQGRLDLADPPSYDDLTEYLGQWYVPFPPLPALLMLPLVALLGVASVNTVVFGAALGAVNVALAFGLLQTLSKRGWTQLGLVDNLWLTVLFGVGSVHWYMATLGSVWFVSQISTATFMLAAALSAAALGSPLLAGASLALAMLARPHVALCFPLLLALGMQRRRDRGAPTGRWHWVAWSGLALVPLALAALALLWYNQARFDNPFEFGYLHQNVKDELLADLGRYGQFNLHYVPHNLWVMLLAGPIWDAEAKRILPSIEGMSLLLTTPALVYVVRARQRSIVVLGAWLALALLLVPLLLYYNTGWWQFGYRFSLDFMTPVLVLLAFGARERVGWTMRSLILIGVLVNAWGTWWYFNPRFF